METIRISCIVAIVLLLTTTSYVMASDFVCGSKIVDLRDRQYDVLRKCGEPSHVEGWEEVRIKGDLGFRLLEAQWGSDRWPLSIKELVTVEEWEYNFGPGRFIRYLRFENGRLIRITEGDYGY